MYLTWNATMGHPIVHSACRQIAFYLTEMPRPGDIISAAQFRFPDGTRPIVGAEMKCGSCSQGMTLEDINRSYRHLPAL